MSTYIYTRNVTSAIYSPVLYNEIANVISGFAGWNTQGSTAYDFMKSTTWTGAQEQAVDAVVLAHDSTPPLGTENQTIASSVSYVDPGAGSEEIKIMAPDPVASTYIIRLPAAPSTATGDILTTSDTSSGVLELEWSSDNVTSQTDILTLQSISLKQDPNDATFLGFATGSSNTGTGNTGYGHHALKDNIGGADGTALGYRASEKNVSGGYNTAIGSQSLVMNTAGQMNTAVGTWALRNFTGSASTCVGAFAGAELTTGERNTGVGYFSNVYNVSGSDNCSVGHNSSKENRAHRNTSVGSLASELNNAGTDNCSVGYAALRENVASENTAVGSEALKSLTTGVKNVGVGFECLNKVVSGDNCSAVGYGALKYNLANDQTACGYEALTYNTSGIHNTAVGARALSYSETGGNNTALGYNTLHYAGYGSENVNNNTAVGSCCLELNSLGENNSAIGSDSLIGLVSGSDNIAVGYLAGANYTSSESGNLVLGNSGVIADNNQIRIGSASQHTACYVSGIHGVTPGGGGTPDTVVIDSNGQLGSAAATSNTAPIVTLAFGGDLDSSNRYLIVNGNGHDGDQSTSNHKTRCPLFGGTLLQASYRSQSADTDTDLDFVISGAQGVNVKTLAPAGSSSNYYGVIDLNIVVSATDYLEVKLAGSNGHPERTLLIVQLQLAS